MIEDASEIVASIQTWFLDLPLVSKYIFGTTALAFLISLVPITKAVYRIFILARRWVRRKLIPRKVDLKLDRDIPYEYESNLDDRSSQPYSKKYFGDKLSDNITRMEDEAPFKPPKRDEEN